MHKIKIFSIEKHKKDEYDLILSDFEKMLSKYARIESIDLFNKKIAQSQKINAESAKKSYSDAIDKNLGNYNIFLHERGEFLDSMEFSKIFNKEFNVNFYIAGAYGFEENFLKKADRVISLSKITMSHKIAKLVLFEQIYRALTIVNKHPYHK